MKKILMSAVACALLSGSAYAGGKGVVETEVVVIDIPEVTEEYGSYYSIGLKAGTLGIGLDVAMPLSDHFSLRGNVNGFTYDFTDIINDALPAGAVDFGTVTGGDMQLLTAGILVDYFPWQTGLRISAGAYYNANKFTITGDASTNIKINGNTYTNTEVNSATATLDFDNLAPYLGLGWGSDTRTKGWGVSFDVGVMYHGTPQGVLDVQQVTPPPATSAAITASETQANIDIATELDKTEFKFYPVIMIGLTYSF